MFNKIFICLILLLLAQSITAQNIGGKVFGAHDEDLIGATVHWLNTTDGVITNDKGQFEIPMSKETNQLVFSFVGYNSDTVIVDKQKFVLVALFPDETLEEVIVEGEKSGTYTSNLNAIKTSVITDVELTKSACCDLAGCFETQGSVKSSTTNVITQSKELRILGLSGVYTQILVDGMPLVQGLTYTYGISNIPGTLVHQINVAMGATSVLQGFESMNGQINIELKEPESAEKLLLNLYVNSFAEKQFNANYTHKFKKWSTVLAAHTTQPANKIDRDDDTFLDLPLTSRYSFFNKWKYGKPQELGFNSMIGLRYVDESRVGGQMDFDSENGNGNGTLTSYGQTMNYSQPEIYTKSGYRFDSKHSIVLISSALTHSQKSTFGATNYDANQQSFYSNLQYELEWGKHLLKTGVSYRLLNIDEDISFRQNELGRTYDGNYQKNEQIKGVFAENVFNWQDNKVMLITGLRLDNHNQFGYFVTPRTLLKYDVAKNTTMRAAIGTGYRTFNLFSENVNLLASSRDIIITEELKPETVINWGINLVHSEYFDNITATLGLDFYRTQFTNQIFPDYDTDPTKAYISNFTGTSISNGFQTELEFKFYDVFEFKTSYNYLDVYQIIDDKKKVLPFNAKHRIMSSLSYKPKSKKWHADVNIHWYGKQNLANTDSNPIEYRTPLESKPYTIVNAQFTKKWDKFDVYVGCENIFDFRQKRPIIGWQDPFGAYFDTSNVWGPTRGREIYLGVKYKIK